MANDDVEFIVKSFLSRIEKPQEKVCCFFGKDVIDSLLMRDSDSVNSFFESVLFISAINNENAQLVTMEQLYVVPIFDTEENFHFFFGEEMLSPSIRFQTFDQLKESCDWYKNNGLEEAFWCDSYDMWAEFQLEKAFQKLKQHLRVMSMSIYSWHDVYLEEGEGLQKVLLSQSAKKITSVRRYTRFLKDSSAPVFMINNTSEELARLRKIHSRLENP